MSKKLNINSKVQRNPDLLFHDIDGEIVMLDIEEGRYYGLDMIGSRIWELVEHPVVISQLITTLIAEFDVNFENCKNDVMDFLKELALKKLILVF
jgi:hypothetical protein